MTGLETAIWDAGERLRSLELGQMLQAARMSVEQNTPMSDPTALARRRDDLFAGYELSFDPAVQRSLAAAQLLRITEPRLDLSHLDGWLAWADAGCRALRRIAAKCWNGIPQGPRMALFDEDDLPLISDPIYINGSRRDEPGTWLRFAGFDDVSVRVSLREAWETVRRTEAFTAAKASAQWLESNGPEFQRFAAAGQQARSGLEWQRGELLAEYSGRVREIAQNTYRELPAMTKSAASDLRHFNALVQQVLWTLVGLAEAVPIPAVVTEVAAPLRIGERAGLPQVRLATNLEAAPLLRLSNPVWLRLGTPVDGLTITSRISFSLAPASDLTDLTVVPFRSYMRKRG